MSDNQAKVAIVTGGSRGIGRVSAEKLAASGYAVVINFASNQGEADATLAAIAAAGGQAIAFKADVADEKAIAELFDTAEKTYGGIDVVVHAAGRMSLAPLIDMDLQVLDEMHRTNIRGTFVVNQQAARRLRSGSSILNFSSSVIGRILPNYSGYAASKGAVEAISIILASELRGRNINVNAIAPGPTATDLFFNGKDEKTIAFFAQASPLQRLGTPADIAEAVAFLTGPSGHWVNGQTIRVNGGIN
jgi:3-oxoacyl-[acyl-carrier protein] reductase